MKKIKTEEFIDGSTGLYVTDLWLETIVIHATNECTIKCVDPTVDSPCGHLLIQCEFQHLMEICQMSREVCRLLTEHLEEIFSVDLNQEKEIAVIQLYKGALYLNNLKITIRKLPLNPRSSSARYAPVYRIISVANIGSPCSLHRERNRLYGQLLAMDQFLAYRYAEYLRLSGDGMKTSKARVMNDLETDELFYLAQLHYNHLESRKQVRLEEGIKDESDDDL